VINRGVVCACFKSLTGVILRVWLLFLRRSSYSKVLTESYLGRFYSTTREKLDCFLSIGPDDIGI
jgi:hypothetical protein